MKCQEFQLKIFYQNLNKILSRIASKNRRTKLSFFGNGKERRIKEIKGRNVPSRKNANIIALVDIIVGNFPGACSILAGGTVRQGEWKSQPQGRWLAAVCYVANRSQAPARSIGVFAVLAAAVEDAHGAKHENERGSQVL
jgi:hypothetical protein